MTRWQPAAYKARCYMGRALLAVGLVALAADLAFLTPSFEHLIESWRQGLLGLVPMLGLSLLNAARAIALQQIDYFSLVSHILVLCSAFVLMVIGVVILSAQPTPPAASDQRSLAVSVEGGR